MQAHFPLGATACKRKRSPSRWSEFSFAFHQIVDAINPTLNLKTVIANWNVIAQGLQSRLENKQLRNVAVFLTL